MMFQMADKYREIRRTPPLLVHFGNVSTLASDQKMASPQPADKQLQATRTIRKLNKLKAANPPADYIKTNMTQWGNNSVEGSYLPQKVLKVFWGKFARGDVVDVRLTAPGRVNYVYVATGFGRFEARRGDDMALSAAVLMSSDCRNFWWVQTTNHDGNFIYKGVGSEVTRCVRFQVFKGQSDWLRVRLFHVRVSNQIHP